ncbi:hypothetical protein K2173_013386 [Erythroxylum novogranatense]|uniref:EF-hand domain-containing protein n=1 Tax=Erythroxylum novogranatense TaxID=1862640 RepID=A0AAV8SA83_9ROSI|nr:hypothetical protein K2173_013386 [Erythroxylum novogranatense]
MEALGLHKMSSSFMGSSQKLSQRKGKRKVVYEDDDYLPNHVDDEDVSDEDFPGGRTSSKLSKNKVKNKDYKLKNKVPEEKNFSREDSVKPHDDELMQAIALSLGEDSVKHSTLKERKGNGRFQEDEGKRKRKKSFSSRVKMTEDELILHFFQFDELGRGLINRRDLQRVATAHDFMWSENEIADMIHCFDNDGDGKLNLDDFRKIVVRCNMIQGPEDN